MRVEFSSPSNIAIVKYWGKHGVQLPNNPSISLTLSRCRTTTSIEFSPSSFLTTSFLFEGKDNEAFKAKIDKFLMSIAMDLPFLQRLHLKIESSNSFPHSSGIASSASSMSALVLCLMDIERMFLGIARISLERASYFSRLASGSACRSLFPGAALWGETSAFGGSSDSFAVGLDDILHPVFSTFHDTILIVSSKEKSVSSRAGHALMDTHPEAAQRYEQARRHTEELLRILQDGDLDAFITMAEEEALMLHHLMETSNPPYRLIEDNTLQIIAAIRRFRNETKIPVGFTLDAGPNVHCLFPEEYSTQVNELITNELAQYCHENRYISDHVG